MTKSASGQDEANSAFSLATQASKLGPSCPFGIFRVGPARTSSLFGHMINPLLNKLVRSRWLYIGLVLFAVLLTSTSSRSRKSQKQELGQYPAILAEQAWSI